MGVCAVADSVLRGSRNVRAVSASLNKSADDNAISSSLMVANEGWDSITFSFFSSRSNFAPTRWSVGDLGLTWAASFNAKHTPTTQTSSQHEATFHIMCFSMDCKKSYPQLTNSTVKNLRR
jgi:hypothetical protein